MDSQAIARRVLGLGDPVGGLTELREQLPAAELACVLHAVKRELSQAGHVALGCAPVDFSWRGQRVHFDLLLPRGVFAPDEAWSPTFLEGLLHRPLHEYEGRRLIELGTGSGWISFALLRLTSLSSALGLDLNPMAVSAARLNAVLNAFDSEGSPRPGDLATRFSAEVSDLLAAPRRAEQQADMVVGCLPQVPPVVEGARALEPHELGDYSVRQGLAEDRFGLGLNARALRESLFVLRPGGSVVLNLADRPGTRVLHEMFHRRGFEPRALWRARVTQSPDTDIASLARLEQENGEAFGFHLHRHSHGTVPAHIALQRRGAGLSVHHGLHVIEGAPRRHALNLAGALARIGMEAILDATDTGERADEEERLRVSAEIAAHFATAPRMPYPHERGDSSLRSAVSRGLWRLRGLRVPEGNLFAAPNRTELLYALMLCVTVPGDRVVLSDRLRPQLEPAARKAGVEVLWTNDDAQELAELLHLTRPRLLLLADAGVGLNLLLKQCEQQDVLLLLDIPDNPLAPDRESGGDAALTFVAEHFDHGHLGAVLNLAHHESRSTLGTELAMLVSGHGALMTAMEAAAELTWSRVSYLHQRARESALDELLAFTIGAPGIEEPRPARSGPPATDRMRAVLATPPFARPAPASDVIRLDYGENELPLPPALRAAVLRALLRSGSAVSETSANSAVAGYLRATRMPQLRDEQVVLGMGTMPLLHDALLGVGRMLGRPPVVLLPRGSYGMFAPLLQCVGAVPVGLATTPPDFLATAQGVREAEPFDVLLLTSPANPSGAAYSAQQLRTLIALSAARGARVVLDEVFGLLAGLGGQLPLGADRWAGLDPSERRALLVTAGASKEFAAGGLRLGFAATADPVWAQTIKAMRLHPLPPYLPAVAAHLFADLPALWPQLEDMRGELRARRDHLAEGLRELGFGVPEDDRGGLFLNVDLTPLTDVPQEFVLALEHHARVRLNTPAWSGTDAHARACFAIPEPAIDEALHRLGTYLRGARHHCGALADAPGMASPSGERSGC